MWKEFKHLLKNIFSTKFGTVRFIAILFIPLLYGFLYIASFWNPLGYTKNLDIGIVVKDTDPAAIKMAERIGETRKVNDYELNIKVLRGDSSQVEDLYSYVEIPANFTQELKDYFGKILDKNEKEWPSPDSVPQLIVHGSYKKNYVVAEMTELLSHFANTATGLLFVDDIIDVLKDKFTTKDETLAALKRIEQFSTEKDQTLLLAISKIMTNYINAQPTFDSNTVPRMLDNTVTAVKKLIGTFDLVKVRQSMTGKEKSTYGYGLAPFFISIAVWIGALMQSFIVKPWKRKTKVHWLQNWMAKLFLGYIMGIVQTAILLTALIPIGLNLGGVQELYLYLFGFGLSMIFTTLVYAIIFMFPHKKTEVGKLIVLILLIVQLVASGGIFPTELQPSFYTPVSYALPFKYSILGLREVIYDGSWTEVFKNIGYMMIFVAILMPVSMVIQTRVWGHAYKHPTPKDMLDQH